MISLLLRSRLLVTLAMLGGSIFATKQAAAAHVLPPSVMQAIDLINSKTGDLMASFNGS